MLVNHSKYHITIEKTRYSEFGEHSDFNKYLVDNSEVLEIKCNLSESIRKVVINGNGVLLPPNSNSYICDIGDLVLCIGGDVCMLTLPELNLKWRTNCDEACCFQIIPFNNGFIVHGELTITHIEFTGKILWSFTARDIFVTPKGSNNFKIVDNVIRVIDWQGYEYHIDTNGNCIKETRLSA